MNLKAIRNALGTARNVAHDLVAVIGVAAGSVGATVSVLDSVGIHVSSATANAAHLLLFAGLGATALSKGIDSLNDALKGVGLGQTAASAATSHTGAPSVTVSASPAGTAPTG